MPFDKHFWEYSDDTMKDDQALGLNQKLWPPPKEMGYEPMA